MEDVQTCFHDLWSKDVSGFSTPLLDAIMIPKPLQNVCWFVA